MVVDQKRCSQQVLEVKAVSLGLGKQSILADVNLCVNSGECLAVVGPNGAGKSSLFRVISGEWPHYQGKIYFNQHELQFWTLSQLARMRAVMPQNSSLSFPYTVAEVVMLGRLPHSSGQKKDREICQQVMTMCDVAQFAERSYLQLSGGERQRVQLARVLAQIWTPVDEGPRVLLLDEPTSALDLSHQLALMEMVKQVAQAQVAVVIILHDLNLAARFADRIMVMHQGAVDALGTPEEVMVPQRIRRVFGVDANVIPHPEHQCPLIVY